MQGRIEQDMKYDELLNKCLESCDKYVVKYIKSIQTTHTAATRYRYGIYLRDFFEYLDEAKLKMINVKPMDLNDYMEYIRYNKKGNENSPQIRNARLAAIRSFYNFLLDNDIVDKNPTDKVRKVKNNKQKDIVYLTPKEIEEIRDNIETGYKAHGNDLLFCKRDLAIFNIGVSTGLRISAIVNINLEDIDFDNNTISVVEKGNKYRTVYIGENTKKSILNWLEDKKKYWSDVSDKSDALFINQSGERLRSSYVNTTLKRVTETLDKKITPHKLRSTCAMNLYEQTHDIYLVQQQLGHKDIRNTEIYAKASDAKRREAANILDNL